MDIYIRAEMLGVEYKRLVHAEPLEMPGAIRKYTIHEDPYDGCFVITDAETGTQIKRHAKRKNVIADMKEFIRWAGEARIAEVLPTLQLAPLDDLPEWVGES